MKNVTLYMAPFQPTRAKFKEREELVEYQDFTKIETNKAEVPIIGKVLGMFHKILEKRLKIDKGA